MTKYWVRLKKEVNLKDAIIPLRNYYSNGIAPLSRGHTLELTEAQAEIIKQLPNVVEVSLAHDVENVLFSSQTSFFNKDNRDNECVGDPVSPINKQPWQCLNWGLLECTTAPNNDWGINEGYDQNSPDYNYWLQGTADIHSEGEHVDIIITDTMVPFDHPELNWSSTLDEGSRFVQYDWHQLTPFIISELGYTPGLTETYTYASHANLKDEITGFLDTSSSHGLHVATTAAGLRNGWAKKANVYSITLPFYGIANPQNQSTISFNDVFYYLRAFHLTKPINPITGKKNPTIVNCSWGSFFSLSNIDWKFINEIVVDGVTYSSQNPFPHGWSIDSFYWESGIGFNSPTSYHTAIRSGYIDDCAEDGVILVAAAGNYNKYLANENDIQYNDRIVSTNFINPIYYRRNQWSGAITVGAMGNNTQRTKAIFSNFGPSIDVFAPGQGILASVAYSPDSGGFPGATDLRDLNYGVDDEGNVHRLYQMSGTSMAAPQVTGTLACHASSVQKYRYTISDAQNYLNQTSNDNRLGTIVDYYYNPGLTPTSLNYLNNLGSRYDGYFTTHDLANRKNYVLKEVNSSKFDLDIHPNSYYRFSIVNTYDIYGNSIDDIDKDNTFTLYEDSFTFRNDQYYQEKYSQFVFQDNQYYTNSGQIEYSTHPYEAVDSSGNAVDSDMCEIDISYVGDDPSNDIYLVTTYVRAGFGFIDHFNNDTVILRDSTNTDVQFPIKFIKPPENIINYKFRNWTNLADSKPRVLVCKSTRPDNGVITHPEGQRTSGLVYPRGSKVYS